MITFPQNKKQNSYIIPWIITVVLLFFFTGAVIFFKDRNNQSANLDDIVSRTGNVYTVYYANFNSSGVFSPTNLSINLGDTVSFQNDGKWPIRIVSESSNAYLNLEGFDSMEDVMPKNSFVFTFTQKGVFEYHNEYIPDQKGTIMVK